MGTLKTNHHERQFTYRCDVPEDVLANQFDYLDPEEDYDDFFCYLGVWYHVSQFEYRQGGIDADHPEWTAVRCDTFFSAVVLKPSDDGETFQVGTYYA